MRTETQFFVIFTALSYFTAQLLSFPLEKVAQSINSEKQIRPQLYYINFMH